MIYLITGANATAKHLLSSLLAKKISSKRITMGDYIIEPDENKNTEIYSIIDSKTNEVAYMPASEEKGIIKDSTLDVQPPEYDETIYDEAHLLLSKNTEAIKMNTGIRFYYTNSLLVDVTDDEETIIQDHNAKILENMINDIKNEIKTNKDVIYVTNITGKDLTDFEAAFDGISEIIIIDIIRNPLISFIMDNLDGPLTLEVKERIIDSYIASYVRSLNSKTNTIKFEDIMKNNEITIDGSVYTFRNIFQSTKFPLLTDYEVELLKNKTVNSDIIGFIPELETIFTNFDADENTLLEAGVCPSNILDYFGYADTIDLTPFQ
jgi:hypothetical protein